MKRMFLVPLLLVPSLARAEFLEMKQTIFGMD
jgi:hypothetical protein